MEGSTIDSMCRCCAAEGIFKDIKTSYHWMGEEEVYGDILRECFDIKLATVEEGGICEVCITQLRNAANFKKQVLHTEKKFKRHLETRRFKPTEVKEEDGNSSDDIDRGDDSAEDEDYVPDFEIPIKTETTEESKSRKRAAKATTSRAKKSKIDADDKTLIMPVRTKTKKRNIITINPKEERVKLQLVTKRYDELSKHQTNVRTILLCTNATPIRKYGGVGYMCCFCDREYPEPSLLKSHTRRSHDKSLLSTYTSTSSMANFVVKLDITDLHCILCAFPLSSVEAAADHLVAVHSQPYYKGLKSHVLPFRFTGGFRCVLCVMQFSNFKVLLEHMNVHFRNHVCDTCGKGYVNKVQYQTHTYRHRTGQFVCSICTKVFDTQVKCREHKRATHVLKNTRSKCGYCGERFKDYTKKREHEVLTHGAMGVSLQCRACDRTFSNQRALSVHTKTYHLMERTVPK